MNHLILSHFPKIYLPEYEFSEDPSVLEEVKDTERDFQTYVSLVKFRITPDFFNVQKNGLDFFDNMKFLNSNSWKGIFGNRNNKEGFWEDTYDNGRIYSKGVFVNGKSEGLWIYYYITGELKSKKVYFHGEKISEIFWNKNGKIRQPED